MMRDVNVSRKCSSGYARFVAAVVVGLLSFWLLDCVIVVAVSPCSCYVSSNGARSAWLRYCVNAVMFAAALMNRNDTTKQTNMQSLQRFYGAVV